VWRRFIRSKVAVVGLVLGGTICLCALLAPLLTPYDPAGINLRNARKGPSWDHVLGTDTLGRDILSRVLYGARISIQLSLISVGCALAVGGILGLVAGYCGGAVDYLAMRFVDILLCFPSFLLALAVISVLGRGLDSLIIALAVSAVPRFARVARASASSLRPTEFVQSAQAIGASSWRIIATHILPNSVAPLVVLATTGIANAVLIAAGLGFLGLGAQPPTPEWGLMVSEGRGLLRVAPHISTAPGAAIALFALSFNLMGDGLRDALDVQAG